MSRITLLLIGLCKTMSTVPPLPATMQVIATSGSQLTFQTKPLPTPSPTHVLIQLHASGINPVDVQNTVLGFEGSGVISSLGSNVSRWSVGEEIMFLASGASGGAYAEYISVDARLCAPKPPGLSHSEAACIPLCYLTAREAIATKLRLGDDVPGRPRRLLVMGGAGGVGSFALAVAKSLPNVVVTATASSEASAAHCRAMGADCVVHHEAVAGGGGEGGDGGDGGPSRESLPENSFDAVLCCAPLTHMEAISRVTAPFGRICAIVGGKPLSCLDVGLLMFKSIALEFVVVFGTLRFGDLPESALPADAVAQQGQLLSDAVEFFQNGGCDVRNLLKAGGVVEFSPEAIEKVHETIAAGHSRGRWVVKIRD